MTAICLSILSFSAIQQFELAFEGKLQCDCAKTIMAVSIRSVFYYQTLNYNSCYLERRSRADL
mgnify:CR=1 FL=1